MSNGRKAKGGTSILKRLAGGNGNGDKTKLHTRTEASERNTPTQRGQYRPRETQQREPPQRGRHRQSRMYPGEKVGREQKPKVERESHRERVEEHKKKHRPGLKEGEHWIL